MVNKQDIIFENMNTETVVFPETTALISLHSLTINGITLLNNFNYWQKKMKANFL